MAKRGKGGEDLRFQGPPDDLTAALAEAAPESSSPELEVELPHREDGGLRVSAFLEARGHVVRASLPEETPPGVYAGTLSVDGGVRSARVRVEPAPDVRAVPEQLRIEGGAGDRASVRLTLVNLGNVPLRVRRTHAVGVFLEGGVERALRRSYVRSLEDDERRIDVLGDHLAEAHGGLLKMRVEGGETEVPPGAVGELDVSLKLPSGLQPGRVYSGSWTLEDLVYPIRVVVPQEARIKVERGGEDEES